MSGRTIGTVIFLLALVGAVAWFTQRPPGGLAAGDAVVIAGNGAQVRSCPEFDCDVVAVVEAGAGAVFVGSATGDEWGGSNQWVEIEWDGGRGFVPAGLVSG